MNFQLPDEIILLILQYSNFTTIEKVLKHLNHQFYKSSHYYFENYLQNRYHLYGCYKFDLLTKKTCLIYHDILTATIKKNVFHYDNNDNSDNSDNNRNNDEIIGDDYLSFESILEFLMENSDRNRDYSDQNNCLELLIDYYELMVKWMPGTTNFTFHSNHLPYDHFFAYPIVFTGAAASNNNNNSNNYLGMKITCVDLETFSNIRWSIQLKDLKWPLYQLSGNNNRSYQNKRQLFVTLKDDHCRYVMSIRKDLGIIEFIYNITHDSLLIVKEGNSHVPLYDQVKALNEKQTGKLTSTNRVLDNIITSRDYLIISCRENESQSNNYSTLTCIHLRNFEKKTILKWNRMKSSINTSLTDLENEFSQDQTNCGNLLLLDIRSNDSRVTIASLKLDSKLEDINLENYRNNFQYCVPMINGSRNLHVDLTCLGSEYYLISGVDDKHKIRTELVNLKSGEKIENLKKPTAVYMVENLNNNLVGLVSITETHLAFCKLNINVIEEPEWEIPIHELTKFPYYPNVQTILIENYLIVSIYGSAGFYMFCFNAENGQILWKDIIIESTEMNRFSHFDVSCNISRNISLRTRNTVAICGSSKEHAFFFIQYQAETGERQGPAIHHINTWENHIQKTKEYHQQVIQLGNFIINQLNRQKRKKCCIM
ncbi:predicted protein [Naegleria gruberi]|uniref:Predicted protein n=1 Tax=Naegleria gruberi TaxID=5762 RepID=D2VV57_NAEGR|nr:uncharacterized protein NAEGRDRAFT_72899 [Naegleria gruberi]EFC39179.1 predicted protein [Naegleria gruberi]|eukprot:XP_002671923.1 predicted protein [Naegleria gruberi strain NEG-M]